MPAYLDNAATTRVCPEAARAALEAMTEGFGNPSARYAAGQAAAARVAEHRAAVARRLGCDPAELTFTSCGTEGDNWAVRAAAEHGRRRGRHIITTAIEHAAVLEPVKALAAQGYEVTYLKPDRAGRVSVDELRAALREDTVLVSMMLVNNELGTLQPVAQAAQAIRDAGSPALLHCDAVQGFLKVPFTPARLGVDMLTLSGHKLRAPKGIGVQYIRKGLNLKPLLLGGGQESGLRSGTEPTAQIAALAAACDAWGEDYPARISVAEGIRPGISLRPPRPGDRQPGGRPPHLRRVPARLPQRDAGAGSVRPGGVCVLRLGLPQGQTQPRVCRPGPAQAHPDGGAAHLLRPGQHQGGRGRPGGRPEADRRLPRQSVILSGKEPCPMRITVLIENSAPEGLVAEHGLSFYLEYRGGRYLLDAGESGAFLLNAQRLGVDLSRVEAAALSHGHYDHGDGFTAFFRVNRTAQIHARPAVREDEYWTGSTWGSTPACSAATPTGLIWPTAPGSWRRDSI